ncbi:L-threonylcarbamoyladenylate synthase [Fusibacter ferrireducens]|uniref:Threonylcarbamoyl-AMP synthase n=1 Tax=Fusibacter ferrireducens TaxID=2785058 RepID=A0ABR9ZVR7_9FIRM|nr:L-threonylcarbamoyladenylate synthase [Fusibacter ferrireducens]MBF4694555.1 threonylcarbamoyl-AMP synthase [Fusibacter ferrireducens]
MTKLIKIEEMNIDALELTRLLSAPAEALRQGGTVAFPTETVYGLGANALSDVAVAKIYEAKGRPSDNPLIVHISKVSELNELVLEIKPYALELMSAFWPGPITFIFRKNPKVPSKVTGGLDTVAVRMPDHPIALKLIELSGVPVAAPSANLSGKPSPTKAKHVIEDLMGKVDFIIDGPDAKVGLESTVLDVTGDMPMILRPGKITPEMIENIVGGCQLDPAISAEDLAGLAPRAPGMKYKHYAPEAEVEVVVGEASKIILTFESAVANAVDLNYKLGIMGFEEDLLVLEKFLETKYKADVLKRHIFLCTHGSIKHVEEFARLLFQNLRRCDEVHCDKILIRGVSEHGIGYAIMNRLKKASGGKVIRI